MSVWPDLRLNTFAPLEAAAFDWPALRNDPDATGLATVAPPISGIAPRTVVDSAEPLDLAPPPLTPTRIASKRGPWSLAAMIFSAAVHAAALYVFAVHLAQSGVEADSDAVSVEIVLEPNLKPAPIGVAGNAADTGAETAPTEPETAEEHPPLATSLDHDIAENASDPDEVADAPAAATSDALPVDGPDGAIATDIAAADVSPRPSELPPSPAATSVFKASAAENPATSQEQPPRDVETALAAQPSILVADPFVRALSERPVFPPPPPAIDLPPMDNIAALASPPPVTSPAEPADAGVRAAPKPVAKTPVEKKPTKAVAGKTSVKDNEPKAKPVRAAKPKPDAARADPKAKPQEAPDRTPKKTASVAGSAATSGASTGAQAQYSRKIVGHVQRFKHYPQEAARNGTRGAVKVSITIDRAGRLSGARVAAGSGHAVLDREALATARRASPYPRPPEGLGGRAISISFTLRFDG